MATFQKRAKPVKVLMTEATYSRLVALGEALGQTPSTLASVAVSEYVAKMTSQFSMGEKAMNALISEVAPGLKEQMKLAMEAAS